MMTGIQSVVLKIASHCNLNCSYCYVYNHEDKSYLERPKFISDETYEAALARLLEYCERRDQTMAITFHGGEPTLVGPERFDHLARRAHEVLGRRLRYLSIQTNGALLNQPWVEVLWRWNVSVGISMDGPARIHDRVRVTHSGEGSHASVVDGVKRLQDAGMRPGVLSVVFPGEDGKAIYEYFRSLDFESISFLIPDVSHDNREAMYGAFGPKPVARYLIPAFDAWFEEDNPKVRVRPFKGLMRMLLGGSADTDAFGNPLMAYLIIETDGSLQALDALRVCREGISVSGLNVFENGLDELSSGLPLLHQAVHEGFPLSETCNSCGERDICGGGYLPQRYSNEREFDNPSVWCDDILDLLTHIRSRCSLPAANAVGSSFERRA